MSGQLRLFISVMSVLVFCGSARGAAPDITIDPQQRAFTIKTERLEATFKDGRIVHLYNRLTDETIADEQLDDTRFPAGMGHLSGGVEALSKLHHDWGSRSLASLFSSSTMDNFRAASADSVFTCELTEKGVRAVWTGLSNEKLSFPHEVLTIEAETDVAGALVFRASATSPTGGVFGVIVPLVNILPSARFYLPSFGGMRFDTNSTPSLRTFGGAPFYEAPVMAAEVGRGSVGLWKEDDQFHSYFTFFNWSGKSFGFACEHLNLMPFEPHTRIDSVNWKLDVTDGGWMQALAPYKQWYAEYFASELETRDTVTWADQIGVVIDQIPTNRDTLDKLAAFFPPESVLMHEWNARAPGFDVDLPDWTPRDGYIDKVNLMHEYGFKTMAYVNTYCATYNSPVWQRDNLSELFLTRKYSLSNYAQVSEDDVQGEPPVDQFADIVDGRLLYGDPLHSGWRQYHVEQMAWWNTTTGTDANYEDTAGVSGDFGNGVVDGLSGAQGSVAMMRELLARQPGVSMASEYGPDTIAFAVKWPLVYAQVWGGDAFRAFRAHAQVPVNAYLFGYRAWIPTINAGTDFLKHVVTASSDAAGGMGMTSAASEVLDCRSGFTGHMVWRSHLFANRGLRPYFDPLIREPNLVCMYRDREDGLYRYTDDGRLQRMTGPDGHDLYARVDNTNRLETALRIPGWPAVSGNTLFGLDPTKRYALFPPADETRLPVQFDSLPEGIGVRMSRHDDDYALLVLDRANPNEGPAQAAVPVTLNRSFETVCVNGTTWPLTAGTDKVILDLTFPAHILFASAGPAAPFNEQLELNFNRLKIRKISRETGLQELILTNNLSVLKRSIKPDNLTQSRVAIALWGADWENKLDFLVRVPSRAAWVRVYTKANTTSYGDGTIAKLYINGVCVKSVDSYRSNPDWVSGMPDSEKTLRDDQIHEWLVPIGDYAGNAILVTIASDPKRDGNADLQWISIPELIEAEAQSKQDKAIAATGGDYTYDQMIEGSRYRIHVFTNVGPSTLTVTQGGEVEYLVVGGGGAGGYGTFAAGGGGGAVLSNVGGDKLVLAPQTYSVMVGAGGPGVHPDRGGTGSNSVFAAIVAPGGGGGGTTANALRCPGADGSSGGGGAGYTHIEYYFGTGGKGIPGLGHDGGDGNWTTDTRSGGGGGGAGEPGTDGTANVGGDGGNGVPNFITGVELWYGGGGAGSCIGTGTMGGRGGLGGGADGLNVNGLGRPGTPGTGGGGSAGNAGLCEPGGSGIVIIRYIVPISRYTEATGGDVVYERTIDDTRYRIHIFTNVGPSTLTFTQIGEVEYLVVGGGGGGGGFGINHGSGGGGGGAVLSNVGGEKLLVTPQTYAVQVGTGGVAVAGQGGMGMQSVFYSVVAPGGGGGGGGRSAGGFSGLAGSSGGGGAGASNDTYWAYCGFRGKGTPGLGHDGGEGNWSENTKSGGGGGGAGAPGLDGIANFAGDGGQGVSSPITGEVQWFGGGGGGSCFQGTAGSGGLGGGALGRTTYQIGAQGVPNTGGGGGSALGNSLGSYSGSGGSGIVVIRYVIMPNATIFMMQ